MAKQAGNASLPVTVYEALRLEILNGAIEPGSRLKPAELGARFGVSLGVLREALGLLAAQNLVRIDRNRGFHVTPLSLKALAELTFARKINEGAALRLSVQHGGVTWESEVLAAHHRMASEPMFSPDTGVRNEKWAIAHSAFHCSLIKACDNEVLLGICERLSDAAELYRSWSGAGTREVKRDVVGEHKALLDAALAHKADLAVQIFEQHIDRTQEILGRFDVTGRPTAKDLLRPS